MSQVGGAFDKVRLAMGAKAVKVMPHICTLSVPGAPVNAGDGTTTEGSPTETADIPCDYRPLSSYERMTAGALRAGADFALEFPYALPSGTPLVIPADSRVTVGATAVLPEISFEVVGPLPPTSIWKQRYAATLRG